jgi:hypothetical protein
MRSGVPGGVKEHANNHHPGTCGKHLALHQVFLLKVDPGRRGGWGRVVRMRERHSGKMLTMLLVRAAMCLAAVSTAGGQSSSLPQGNAINQSGSRDTSQQVWLGTCEATDSTIPKIIVIGFVGGFAKRDDAKHPEVQFAAQLRVRYSSQIHAEVFSNHEGKKALRQVLCLLDTDRDGTLTRIEKEQAKIIIYGHSWGSGVSRCCSPSNWIALRNPGRRIPRSLPTWPMRSISISQEVYFMDAQKFQRLTRQGPESLEIFG